MVMKDKHISKSMAHVADGSINAVAAALRVLVMPAEDGGYVAQGLEIDYVATGDSEASARKHFAKGFIRTIQSMVRRNRDLGSLYSKGRTPEECWKAFYASADKPVFQCVIVEDLGADVPEGIPRSMHFMMPRPLAVHGC